MSSTSTPKVWRLGISNAADIRDFQKQLKKTEGKEPIYDSQIHVTSADTIYDFVDFLCKNPVKARREYDWGIDQHMWTLKIVVPSESLEERMLNDDTDDDDDDTDEPSSSSLREIVQSSNGEFDNEFDEETAARVRTSAKMGALKCLQVGSKLHLTYDFGTTTDLFLHVLEEKQNKNNVKLGMVVASTQSTANDDADLQAVPAYSLLPKLQIDASYPQTCKTMIKSQRVQFMTLGLSSRISRQDDSVYCCIRDTMDDKCFCPHPFDNMDDFFVLSELGWTNGKGGCLWVLPPNEAGKECYKNLKRDEEDRGEEAIFLFQPQNMVYKDKADKKSEVFNFHQVFPKTAEQLTSGRFRYFRYDPKLGVLKVIVGRSVDTENHNAPPDQILRTWNKKFKSFHELLCAVEASWIHLQTKEPLRDTMLPEHDTYLGPSSPLPKEPPCWSKEEDAIFVTRDGPRVTALAIAEDDDCIPFVISGHADGSIRRWNLETQNMEWSVFATKTRTPEVDWETGIRNLGIREDPLRGHVVYVLEFFPNDEGADYEDIYDECSGVVHVLNVVNGRQVDRIVVSTSPFIGTMVFSRIRYDKAWKDCMIIGCTEQPVADDYGDDAGAIVPVHLGVRGGEEMESWTGQDACCIRQLGVSEEFYLVSVSAHYGHQFPDRVCVWSLSNPGSLLSTTYIGQSGGGRISLGTPFSGLIGGIAIYDSSVLLCGGYGDVVLPIEIPEDDGEKGCVPDLKGVVRLGQRYYDDSSFRGHMAGSATEAVVANSDSTEAWIFSLGDLVNEKDLEQDFSRDEQAPDEDDNNRVLRDRGRAIGTVSFPNRGGRTAGRDGDEFSNDFFDKGPRLLALSGRYVLAGYSSGAIIQAKLLPGDDSRSVGTEYGTLACGTIPQGESHI
jgi:hypothetical protein